MSERHWNLVSYDIRDPVRLRKVARVLLGYGVRLQYSVFRCKLTTRSQARLLWELAQIVTEEDNVIIAPLCRRCSGRLVIRGRGDDFADDAATFRIL